MLDKNKIVLLIGGHGTIGLYLQKLLKDKSYDFFAPSHKELDLLDYRTLLYKLDDIEPHVVINLAARKTTIFLNSEDPVGICSDTLQMNINLLRACKEMSIRPNKIINVISSCAYGENEVLVEDQFFDSSVNESVRPHAMAKSLVYALGLMYNKQYGLPVTHVCFNNIVGGCNWYKSDQLKVCDALIKRFVDAKLYDVPDLTLWGTGNVYREFLYYKDAAASLIEVMKNYFDSELINIGTGYDIKLSKLANGIKLATGYTGNILWDKSKKDGQTRKLFSVEKMKKKLQGWYPPTNFADMIDEVISEYISYRGYGRRGRSPTQRVI